MEYQAGARYCFGRTHARMDGWMDGARGALSALVLALGVSQLGPRHPSTQALPCLALPCPAPACTSPWDDIAILGWLLHNTLVPYHKPPSIHGRHRYIGLASAQYTPDACSAWQMPPPKRARCRRDPMPGNGLNLTPRLPLLARKHRIHLFTRVACQGRGLGWRAWAWGRGLGDRPSGRHRNQAEGHSNSQLKEGGVERRSLGCVYRVMSMGLGGL